MDDKLSTRAPMRFYYAEENTKLDQPSLIDIDQRITRGKYRGMTLREISQENPKYANKLAQNLITAEALTVGGGGDMDDKLNDVILVLEDLLFYTESVVCTHDFTHRAGVLWEICDNCGAKWADDEGGKPEFAYAKEVVAAQELVDRARESRRG